MTLKQMRLDEFLSLAQGVKRLAIYREMMSDRLTPIGVVEHLQAEMAEGTLLESGLQQTEDGRYSYIAFGLMAQLSARGNEISQRIGHKATHSQGDPFIVLRTMLADLVCAHPSHELLRMSGAVGFMSYDAIRLRESIPDRHQADTNLPDVLFNFYHTTLIFDHSQHKLLLAKLVDVGSDPTQTYHETQAYLQSLITKISQFHSESSINLAYKTTRHTPEVDVSDAQFIRLIEKAKHHIQMGDVFQMVLSRCFKQTYTASHLDIYRALRKVSPAPYMFYFPLQTGVMVGASPEKLITVRAGRVDINPIAGTRQRLSSADEPKNASELLADEKELAEHMMLVDLARNDLGMVCEPGTVQVNDLLQVRHFSHVSHLTSLVTGQLRADNDALDALQACFPAGTVSGAPKICAMTLIDEFETSKRGLYGGAFCRLDASGNFDSCIAIRMAILQDGVATIRTGAGIVADSNPAAEAAETRHKARGILSAIALAEEGLSC